MNHILSYSDYLSYSLHESLDPYHESKLKFKIGDLVTVKDRIGKVTAFDGTDYLVMIGSKNERVKESQIEKVGSIKKNHKKATRKKLPAEKTLKF